MTGMVDVFGGTPVQPAQVGYASLTLSEDSRLYWPLEVQADVPVAALIQQVLTTAAGLSLALPVASQASPGSSLLIRNVGTDAFTLTDSSGTNLLTISPGFAYYIYLTDNTSVAGVWGTLVFGGQSAPVSPGALAGAGLTVLSGMLASNLPVTTQNASFNLALGDRATAIIYTGGVGNATLLSAATATNGYWFAISNQGSGDLTVVGTIDGVANLVLGAGEEAIITCSGTAYFTVSKTRSVLSTITRLVLPSTGGTVTLTSAQAANALIYVTGVLTSNLLIEFPASSGRWFIANQTTGAFSVTGAVVGGIDPGTVIPQAEQGIVMSNGTNMVPAQTTTPIAPTSFGNGLVATPSIYLTATNTGFYFPAGNTSIAMATGGVQFFQASPTGLLVNGVTLTDASNNIPWDRLSSSVLSQVQAYSLGM